MAPDGKSPFVFTPPPKLPTVDYAEFLALKVIVQSLVAESAFLAEANGGVAQAVINERSIVCQESLANATGMSDSLRARALENVNRILGSIIFPPSGDGTN